MNITVYAASSGQVSAPFLQATKRLGAAIAHHGHTLVNGAGRTGLMAASAEGCMEAGGNAVGIIPQFMIDQHWQHENMSQLVVTPDMHQRKALMAETGDACIALPGGVGTMEELLEIITWKQLGLYLKPIVIFNIDGFYDALLEQFEKALEMNFMRDLHKGIWAVADTPQQAVELCETIPLWDANVRKFAAM